jgi:hypothetical protein
MSIAIKLYHSNRSQLILNNQVNSFCVSTASNCYRVSKGSVPQKF